MADTIVKRPGFRDLALRFRDRGDSTAAEVIDFGIQTMRTALDVNGRLEYLGFAAVGSAEGAAVWQIAKFTYAGADPAEPPQTEKYADGDHDLDNVWNDRATLSYS